MKVDRFFSVVDSHTAGMPTRVVIGGGPKIPGKTMIEKRNYFRDSLDSARLMLTREPRGGGENVGCLPCFANFGRG